MENKNKKIINMLPFETERLIIKKTSIYDVELILKMDKQEITQKYLGGIKTKTKEERSPNRNAINISKFTKLSLNILYKFSKNSI